MFEKLFAKLRKYGFIKEGKDPEEKLIKEEPQEVDIEVTVLGNITKVDIKEDCTVMEYVPTIKKRSHEWIEDKIPNATLFDSGLKIKRKVVYLFERENIRYSCYTTDDVIHINERITDEHNHIDERIINIYKNHDNYIINRMKHDETRSTYFVKSHEKKTPDYAYFQLGRENAIQLSKEVLANLENISGVDTIIDLDLVYEKLGIKRKKDVQPVIKPVQNYNTNSNTVMIKK